MLRPIVAGALVLALAACASEPRRGERGYRGGPAGAEARLRRGLFVSPSGEPFRGADGLGAWFAGADADHDGSLTPAEFQADAERFFRRLDVNGDGVIDGFELQAYEQSIAPEIAALDIDRGAGEAAGERRGGGTGGGGMGRGGGRRGGGMGGRGRGGAAPPTGGGSPRGSGREGASRYSLINEPEPLAGADENLDGRVTLEEWRRATTRRFETLDKLKAGRLTLEALRGKAPPKR